MNTTPTRPAQISRNVIPFPTRYNHTENSRHAVARLQRGEPFLCDAKLYGPRFPALAELAQIILQTRGRP